MAIILSWPETKSNLFYPADSHEEKQFENIDTKFSNASAF
jgi:hypothetical protein